MLKSGPIVFDADAQRASKHGAELALSGQPFRILGLLMEAPDRIVSRSELKQALWPHAERIDTERRLNTAMRALREALGDTAETPLYVETVRGRGYRWIAGRSAANTARPLRWRLVSAGSAALLCAIAACGMLLPGARSAPLTAQQQTRYIRIAATARAAPRSATQELNAFIAERPDYEPALVLNASLAIQNWRDAPNTQTLAASQQALREAWAAAPHSADLAAIGAELSLKDNLDWRNAEARYRAALDREPSNVEARHGLAWLLLNAGRTGEALRQAEVLLATTGLDDTMRSDIGWLFLRARRPDLARQGVHVAFYSDMNRLRLEVNKRGLEASGLKASFLLFEAARLVE